MTDRRPAARVKCVVWDLDGTLWHGVLAEGGGTRLRDGVRETVLELDRRGVLQSIASKNEPGPALRRLDRLGLAEYFLVPQISWDAKSVLIERVAAGLGIGVDTVAFVDDSAFERAEVADALPEVRCFDLDDLSGLTERSEFDLPITVEASRRRHLYREAATRRTYEEGFVGPRSDFLRSLGMRLVVRPTRAADLVRAAELTQRTHQLNTTGLQLSAAQLAELIDDADSLVWSVSLSDQFGDYGVIGLVVVALEERQWRIRLFLMSCRVMGRNVGGAVLAVLAERAGAAGRDLVADFRPNDVNRQMYLVYRLAGFTVDGELDGIRRMRLGRTTTLTVPEYVDLDLSELEARR